MTENRRRFSRVRFNVNAQFHLQGQAFDVDALYNLSIGGCLVNLPGTFPVGTPCRVDILLNPDAENMIVTVDGEVVRTDQEGVAVKFTQIDPNSLFHLQNIIRYNASDTEKIEQEIDEHPGIV